MLTDKLTQCLIPTFRLRVIKTSKLHANDFEIIVKSFNLLDALVVSKEKLKKPNKKKTYRLDEEEGVTTANYIH